MRWSSQLQIAHKLRTDHSTHCCTTQAQSNITGLTSLSCSAQSMTLLPVTLGVQQHCSILPGGVDRCGGQHTCQEPAALPAPNAHKFRRVPLHDCPNQGAGSSAPARRARRSASSLSTSLKKSAWRLRPQMCPSRSQPAVNGPEGHDWGSVMRVPCTKDAPAFQPAAQGRCGSLLTLQNVDLTNQRAAV